MDSHSIYSDGATIHAETTGHPGHPAVLLIMGAMASGVWWPEEFCEMLAQRSRLVIRYDHRDTGASTSYPPGSLHYTVPIRSHCRDSKPCCPSLRRFGLHFELQR